MLSSSHHGNDRSGIHVLNEIIEEWLCTQSCIVLFQQLWSYLPNSILLYIVIYTLCQKKQDTLLVLITSRNINQFSQFFHRYTLHEMCYKISVQITPHLKDIAALPYEIVMFPLLASSGANTLLKRNVTSGQCFQFPSLSSAVYQAQLSASFS